MFFLETYENVCIYGMTDEAKEVLSVKALEIASFVVNDGSGADVNIFPGKKVISPEKLKELEPDSLMILIADKAREKEIAKKLVNMGFKEGKHFIMPYRIPKSFWKYYSKKAAQSFSWTEEMENKAKVTRTNRSQIMYDMIPRDAKSILDIGAGNQYLKTILRKGVDYYSFDGDSSKNPDYNYDFNSESDFEIEDIDYAFAAGAFEYIYDLAGFLKKILPHVRRGIVFSYHPVEYNMSVINPRSEMWNNALSCPDLIMMFRENGFLPTDKYEKHTAQVIYRFDRCDLPSSEIDSSTRTKKFGVLASGIRSAARKLRKAFR